MDEKTAWAIIEASPDAIVMTRQGGVIELLNERTEAMFGYDRSELLGATVETLIPDDLHEVHRSHRAGYRAAPEVRAMGSGLELRARHRDGSEFPVEISLSPMHIEGELYVLAAIRDISERVAADERDRGIRRALDIVEDGVFMFHADTLRFHYVNAGAVHQVGYTRDELLEMTPLHIQPEYDEITFRALLEPLVSEEQPSIRFTTMHRRCDGVDIPVEIVLQSPPPVRDGERRSCVALCREVGERLRQDAELARLHLQTALLEDRERIARAMHDNVIGRLFGTGLALEATIDRSTDEAVQARLREAVNQIDATISEVRAAVLNDDGGAILGRNVSDEVLALVGELHPALGFEPTVELHGLVNELDDPIVAHLLATLREALTNISRHAKANAAQVSLDVDEHELRLRVVDDGVGITPAASPTTGIGHHGLRNIVARATELGGRATTASPPGGGTTIEWSVPLRFDQDG